MVLLSTSYSHRLLAAPALAGGRLAPLGSHPSARARSLGASMRGAGSGSHTIISTSFDSRAVCLGQSEGMRVPLQICRFAAKTAQTGRRYDTSRPALVTVAAQQADTMGRGSTLRSIPTCGKEQHRRSGRQGGLRGGGWWVAVLGRFGRQGGVGWTAVRARDGRWRLRATTGAFPWEFWVPTPMVRRQRRVHAAN